MIWDYIVVGAGSAGCAVTSELVAAGQRVLVLEAGGWDRSPSVRIAAGQVKACERYDWGYRCEPDQSRGGSADPWLRARVIGGCSSINGTAYTRGIPADYDSWNLDGWRWNDVLPIFRDFEGSDQAGPTRGQNGSLKVRTVGRPHPISRAFLEAALHEGYPRLEDYNGESQDGFSFAQLTQRGGFRCSAADAFLKPIRNRRNLKIVVDALVERIELDGPRATGVAYTHHGKSERAEARNIIVSAGTIASPQLLMLSGLGPAEDLKRLGITPRFDLPAVGKHLKEQPMITMIYKSKIRTSNLTGGLPQMAGMAKEFLLHGEGAISNLFEVAGFIRASAQSERPDLQLLTMTFGYEKEDDGGFKLAPYASTSIILMDSYPRSEGEVVLRSASPADHPIIRCELLGDQQDVDMLIGGIAAVRSIMRQPPIHDLIGEEVSPSATCSDHASLDAFVRSHAANSLHPLGTCRIGKSVDDSVVGTDLRVHGLENLYVADASVIPDHLSANLNAVAIMVGKKLGKQLVRSA